MDMQPQPIQSVSSLRSCCRWRIRASSSACQALRQSLPVRPVGGALVREQGENGANLLEGNPDPLRDADQSDAAQRVAAVAPLVARGPAGLEQTLPLEKMQCRDADTAALGELSD